MPSGQYYADVCTPHHHHHHPGSFCAHLHAHRLPVGGPHGAWRLAAAFTRSPPASASLQSSTPARARTSPELNKAGPGKKERSRERASERADRATACEPGPAGCGRATHAQSLGRCLPFETCSPPHGDGTVPPRPDWKANGYVWPPASF